eukprot:TRINITY_DN26262_c0_g2_i1.p1 TRINITY_DN26262_c0_g2~~TRINITY_DN26262_c0_g2_i1.p1  ORF type:complete len:705 (+),score=76.95 TRINITY_DN26262_c0_g2_i1:240-2117(+)
MAERGDKLALTWCLEALKDDAYNVRLVAMNALEDIANVDDDVVLTALLPYLSIEEGFMRSRASRVLQKLTKRKRGRIRDYLLDLVRHPDRFVRADIARFLRMFCSPGDERCCAALLELCEDTCCRLAVFKVFKDIVPRGDSGAVLTILKILYHHHKSYDSIWGLAADCLLHVALPSSRGVLDTLVTIVLAKAAQSEAAAHLLGKLYPDENDEVAERLIESFRSTQYDRLSWVRRFSLVAHLSSADSALAWYFFEEQLGFHERQTCIAALRALPILIVKRKQACPESLAVRVEALVQDRSAAAQAPALKVLLALGDRKALQWWIPFCTEFFNREVRVAAMQAVVTSPMEDASLIISLFTDHSAATKMLETLAPMAQMNALCIAALRRRARNFKSDVQRLVSATKDVHPIESHLSLPMSRCADFVAAQDILHVALVRYLAKSIQADECVHMLFLDYLAFAEAPDAVVTKMLQALCTVAVRGCTKTLLAIFDYIRMKVPCVPDPASSIGASRPRFIAERAESRWRSLIQSSLVAAAKCLYQCVMAGSDAVVNVIFRQVEALDVSKRASVLRLLFHSQFGTRVVPARLLELFKANVIDVVSVIEELQDFSHAQRDIEFSQRPYNKVDAS